MSTELKLLIQSIILLRNRRKLGKETDEEFKLEGEIADYLKETGNYQTYLNISNGTEKL